jgi:hypothetical protein
MTPLPETKATFEIVSLAKLDQYNPIEIKAAVIDKILIVIHNFRDRQKDTPCDRCAQ